MLVKIKDYDSPHYPIAIEAYNNGRMIYQSVFPACMTDADIHFQINSLWSGYNPTVKDIRRKDHALS